jgi:hypothetical protein
MVGEDVGPVEDQVAGVESPPEEGAKDILLSRMDPGSGQNRLVRRGPPSGVEENAELLAEVLAVGAPRRGEEEGQATGGIPPVHPFPAERLLGPSEDSRA